MTGARGFVIMPYDDEYANEVTDLLLVNGWSPQSTPSHAVLGLDSAFVASNGEQIVGYTRIISDIQTVSYVAELVVSPGWRGQGIARGLLVACANAYPATRIDLLSSEMATGFYEKVGFVTKPGYRRWPA